VGKHTCFELRWNIDRELSPSKKRPFSIRTGTTNRQNGPSLVHEKNIDRYNTMFKTISRCIRRIDKTTIGRTKLLSGPLLDLLFFASMEHQLVRMSRSHARMSLRPVVRNSISENVAGMVERAARNRSGSRLKRCFRA